MIRVTADVFSGRPNPTWTVDDSEAESVLRQIARSRQMLAAAADPETLGLGYRGLVVELVSDHLVETFDLPPSFRLNTGQGPAEGPAQEIAERLISGMSEARYLQGEPLSAAAQKALRAQVTAPARHPAPAIGAGRPALDEARLAAIRMEAAGSCTVERERYHPGFWNDAPHVQVNNCYNYGSNRRTNTFAQPGRASGHFPYQIDCATVSAGAVSDGAHRGGHCSPESEKPRWCMALVVAPNFIPGQPDYHWYRWSAEDFWGHKPGSTPVRNVDNSGQLIHDPQRANRGPYTEFCGYFYGPRKMRIA